jgi:D-threo-aldose 1-dehydrogenase
MHPSDTAEVGTTGLRVTRLGIGGVALSGAPPSTNPQAITSEAEALRLIHRSLEMGVRYFDTAPMYGLGQSEQRFGKGLSGIDRDRYVLSTKVGRVLDPVAPGSTQLQWSFDFSRQGAYRSFRESLARLGMERVDILFIHDPDDHYLQALTQTLPVLMELRAQGLVKAIGAGMNQWEMELRFAQEGDFDCFLLAGRYTLLEQTSLHEFLPYCVAKKISVIAGGPYNSGILAADHLTSAATYNYRESPPAIIEKVQKIKAVCDRHHVPMRAAALQFILAHPAIVSVIPGARSVNELEENFALVTHRIPAAFWAELKAEKLIEAHAPTPGDR